MNRSNAHLYLPHVIALTEGATIQANRGSVDSPKWEDLADNDGEVKFTCEPHLYRRKPETGDA